MSEPIFWRELFLETSFRAPRLLPYVRGENQGSDVLRLLINLKHYPDKNKIYNLYYLVVIINDIRDVGRIFKTMKLVVTCKNNAEPNLIL